MKDSGLKKLSAALVLAAALVFVLSFTAFAGAGGFGVITNAHFAGAEWTDWCTDGTVLTMENSYPTALCFGLENQPEGLSGSVQYSANIQGSGWCRPFENGAVMGEPESSTPFESVSIKLTGSLADKYDVYYRVLQNGAWTAWVCNGEHAGQDCAGLYVAGIQVSVRYKGGPDPTRPVIALTFDDGPSSENTPRVLSYLESVGGKATFFMVGSRVAPNAELLKRMIADGCEVGNHTWGHENLTGLSGEQIVNTLNATGDAVQAACGVRPVVMRPPGGSFNDAVLAGAGGLGMSVYCWSVDTRDWKTRNAQSTIDHVLTNAKDGDIILMHDIHGATADACATLIPELVNRGFQLVTVSELASYRGGGVPGSVYYSLR